MTWFKVALLTLFASSVVINIIKAGGWKPKQSGQGVCAAVAVIDTLYFLGILYLL